jgi:threonine aldolase
MNFASDNWAGAHPQVAQALARHAGGFAAAYGNSDLDKAVRAKFSEVFEREVEVFFVATGTAANSLSMTAFARPGGVFFAHREAHMIADECGAPEYLSGGGRLCPVDGPLGRMDPAQLDAAIRRYPAQFLHGGQPAGVSVTQSSEIGTLYSRDDLGAIAEVARRHELPLHMDGARFANALVSLGCTPAEMTWKAGVDVVSFGGTKNGCWCAEALVVLNQAAAPGMAFIHKRAAQLFSKSRFVSAQFEAYFEDDLWLRSARHSNAMARRLADVFDKASGARLAWQPQANEVFAILRDDRANALAEAGARFYDWHAPHGAELNLRTGEVLFRFVTSFATTSDDVDRVAATLSAAA